MKEQMVTKRYCPKCGGIMTLDRGLHIWTCSICSRRQGAWIMSNKGKKAGIL